MNSADGTEQFTMDTEFMSFTTCTKTNQISGLHSSKTKMTQSTLCRKFRQHRSMHWLAESTKTAQLLCWKQFYAHCTFHQSRHASLLPAWISCTVWLMSSCFLMNRSCEWHEFYVHGQMFCFICYDPATTSTWTQWYHPCFTTTSTIQINKTTSNSNKNMGETHAKKYDKSCHKQQANNPDCQTYNIW